MLFKSRPNLGIQEIKSRMTKAGIWFPFLVDAGRGVHQEVDGVVGNRRQAGKLSKIRLNCCARRFPVEAILS